MSPPWQVHEEWGKVADLHAASARLLSGASSEPPRRTVRVLHATDRAVVLGSAQPDSHVDVAAARALGTEVVRRRSGGGAVLVRPGLVIWIDVVVPADDRLWEADVGRAFWWLGSGWVAALADAGLDGADMWRGGLVRSRWSDRVCFAGVGAGEVTVGGRKAVGISQRRSRVGVLFQCAVPVTWDPKPLIDLLVLDPAERAAAVADLADAAVGVGSTVAGQLAPALLDRLPG
jgi:lipoate-protein ligase A